MCTSENSTKQKIKNKEFVTPFNVHSFFSSIKNLFSTSKGRVYCLQKPSTNSRTTQQSASVLRLLECFTFVFWLLHRTVVTAEMSRDQSSIKGRIYLNRFTDFGNWAKNHGLGNWWVDRGVEWGNTGLTTCINPNEILFTT